MIKEFEMIDIGLMAYYLGIEVKQKNMVYLLLKKDMQKKYSRSSRWKIARL